MADNGKKLSELALLNTVKPGAYIPVVDPDEPLAENRNKRMLLATLDTGGEGGAQYAPYSPDVVYAPSDTPVYVSHKGNTWHFIGPSPVSGAEPGHSQQNWEIVSSAHPQNTDTGTTNSSFTIRKDSTETASGLWTTLFFGGRQGEPLGALRYRWLLGGPEGDIRQFEICTNYTNSGDDVWFPLGLDPVKDAGNFTPYDAGAVYNNILPSYVSYSNNTWEYVSDTPHDPNNPVTPGTDGNVWQLASGGFTHAQNTDEGTVGSSFTIGLGNLFSLGTKGRSVIPFARGAWGGYAAIALNWQYGDPNAANPDYLKFQYCKHYTNSDSDVWEDFGSGGGGASTFADLTGQPRDNAALAAELDSAVQTDDLQQTVRDSTTAATDKAVSEKAVALEFEGILKRIPYEFDLSHIANRAKIGFKTKRINLVSAEVIGEASDITYQLVKIVSGSALAGTIQSTIAAINADLNALTTAELDAGGWVNIIANFPAGKEEAYVKIFAQEVA